MEAATRSERPGPGVGMTLWHVTLTVAGPAVDAADLRRGLERLTAERPFLGSARYASDRVELRYWDEADRLHVATTMALEVWQLHRESAGLPDWHVVGLEVLDRSTLQHRVDTGRPVAASPVPPALRVLGDVRPF